MKVLGLIATNILTRFYAENRVGVLIIETG